MEENKLKTVEQPRDRVVLVGLSSPVLKADSADEESMDELAALVETAGAVSVATVLQNLPSPNPRSFIGEGKVAEIKELIGSTEATMAIFDNAYASYRSAGSSSGNTPALQEWCPCQ